MTFIARLLLALVTFAIPSVACAADAVALSSSVFVERQMVDRNGRSRVELLAPQVVTPGDRLVFILSYRNTGEKPAQHFTVTNPLPQAVAYAGTPDVQAQISVDGGRNWGLLSTLRVKEEDGRWRNARAEDVTHIRWTLAQPLRVGGAGKLSFRGTVR